MFRIIVFAIAIFASVPSFAQSPSDDDIAAAKKICDLPGNRAFGSIAASLKARGQSIYRSGLEGCEAVEQAYQKSKPGIDAKAAADAEAAQKAKIDALAAAIKGARP